MSHPDSTTPSTSDEHPTTPAAPLKRRPRWGAWVAILVCAAVFVYGLGKHLWFEALIHKETDAPYTLSVNKGETGSHILETLQHDGHLVDARLFRLLLKVYGTPQALNGIQPGRYRLDGDLTRDGLLTLLKKGPLADNVFRIPDAVTVAQLRTLIEAAPEMEKTLLGQSDEDWAKAFNLPVTNPEGFFAPDTYHYRPGITDKRLLAMAVDRQKARLDAAWTARTRTDTLTSPYELLILASVIDRETGTENDRPLVSAVFHNRLALKMPLQSDPTVVYGLGSDFTGRLRKRDLQFDTPFNTYTRRGLPAGPIGSPSEKALMAAAHPETSPYLYFVARGDGSSQFSKTLKDHNRAVDTYIRGKKAQ